MMYLKISFFLFHLIFFMKLTRAIKQRSYFLQVFINLEQQIISYSNFFKLICFSKESILSKRKITYQIKNIRDDIF